MSGDIEKREGTGPEPRVIRAACRDRFYNSLEVLSAIAVNVEAKHADRIRAIDTLGRFGLGAADQATVHIHGDVGAMAVGVVHLPTLDVVREEPTQEGQEVGEEERKLLSVGKVPA